MPTIPLSHKERLQRVLRHEPVDRLPTQINYTTRMGEIMVEYFRGAGIRGSHADAPLPEGVDRRELDIQDLPAFLDNHLVRVDLSYPERLSEDGLSRFDWWGAGHDTHEEGYFIRVSPLAQSKDLEAFGWPDPQQADLLEGAKRTIEKYGQEYFIAPNLGFALFERAWSLRGLEQFLMDMASDSGFAGELLDRITEIQLRVIRRYLELGVDGGYFGDDYGAQKGLIMSPASWRLLFKPRLARLFAPFRERGLPVILHSDGQIQKIIPDLIEIGLTALNPVQPEVLEHAWLAENYEGKLAFYGGLSTQTVLPGGSPEQVREVVEACRRQLAPAGNGVAAGAFAPDDDGHTDGERGSDDSGLQDVEKNTTTEFTEIH